jgi:hypothetical protein
MILEEYGESLAYDIAFWVEGLMNSEYPVDEIGRLSLEISDKFRSLAIIVLLVHGDTDLFYHNLIRSGMARERYLKRLRDERLTQDHHFALGRYEPLLDAIAAGDIALARRIVALSPAQWQKEREYEDDYCYAEVLRRLIQEEPPEHEISSFLKQFEACLEGESSARLDVCRALTQRDQEAFDEAFTAILDEREMLIAENKARGQLEDPQVAAQRQVFVEGLAILRLAEGRVLKTEQEYRYCPSLARLPMTKPFPGE